MTFVLRKWIRSWHATIHSYNRIHTTLQQAATLNENFLHELLNADNEYLKLSDNFLNIKDSHNCYVIQPYIKWGPQKLKGITKQEQLDEAKALIQTLPNWRVVDSILVPLETFDRPRLFGRGTLAKLRQIVRSNSATITAVYINLGRVSKSQLSILEREFQVSVFNRYKIVMQILRTHATSKHAKLQVALAELYYVQRSAMAGTGNRDDFRLILQHREQKLKRAIGELREHRQLLRRNRERNETPVVAVVGYTNTGKTALIKSLTNSSELTPKNQLFATLDVTVHAGISPSGLQLLYVDTVGFITDIPATLIECFVATLEDALLADVIVHVEDISSDSFLYKREHVIKTLQSIGNQSLIGAECVMNKVITVGNKCDIVQDDAQQRYPDGLLISAKTLQGLESLRQILEERIIDVTQRKRITFKVKAGSPELLWLYKNATVVRERADSNNEFVFASVIINDSNFARFKHQFV